MTDPYDKIPCCVADAIRQVRIIPVNGIPTGIALLETVIDEVKAMNINDEARLKETLLEKAKIFNYVPNDARDAYADALLKEYLKGGKSGR